MEKALDLLTSSTVVKDSAVHEVFRFVLESLVVVYLL